jgi:hypothetical protein
MLPFGVTFPANVPQRLEIPEGLMNYPVYVLIVIVSALIGGFGGLVVSMLAFGTQVRGSDFSGEKILSMPSFGGEVK